MQRPNPNYDIEPAAAQVEESSSRSAPAARASFHRIALVGNPNVGKSVIFGALTGTYATVSNYPGTTVEVARAAARFDPAIEIAFQRRLCPVRFDRTALFVCGD